MIPIPPEGHSLPQHALSDVLWSLTGSPYADRLAFEEEVRQYQVRIRQQDTWNPHELAMPCSRIVVQFRGLKGGDIVEPIIDIFSDNSEYFTAGELLFKLHNAVVEYVSELDHHFFEGLRLIDEAEKGAIPFYRLCQGS